ncbi:hypothetical protein ABZ815_04375 [Nonomuraea sp. NPDC047529]|uniref:hypothetical protein n=1 Tax=Nonomuraea sp. NPDC047529 TaxID=3155623 RepID=UPI0033D15E06
MSDLEGMVPDGVRALMGRLRRAESSLEAAAEELWGLLLEAGLSVTPAHAVRQAAGWAGQQVPGINQRVLLLERMEQVRPDLFQEGRAITVDAETFAPGKPLPLMGDVGDRLGQMFQSALDLNQNSGFSAAEMAKGAVEAVGGLVDMASTYSTVRLVVDPAGWAQDLEDLGSGLAHGVQHPIELGKALLDWDTWATNPDRAFGRLVPDMLMAAASAGSSGAASGAVKGARAVDQASRALDKVAGAGKAAAKITADGGWEWKGLRLEPEVNRRVTEVFSGLRQAEQDVSANMRMNAGELGAKMEGYPEFVLKSEDRFKEKLAKQVAERPDLPLDKLLGNIPDGIRYTFSLSDDRYTSGVTRARQLLEHQGYELILQKPSWSNPGSYKGINTRWRDPKSGQLFEVQFHTPSSWQAKQSTHDAYEKIEDPTTPPEEITRWERYQEEVFSAVPVPPGARDIPSFTKVNPPR